MKALDLQYKTRGECLCILSVEENGWHMSISCKDRYPNWDEIKSAWYEEVPGAKYKIGAMYFPPINEYVNVMENCFHIYEVKQ